jgi:hypothetical protein
MILVLKDLHMNAVIVEVATGPSGIGYADDLYNAVAAKVGKQPNDFVIIMGGASLTNSHTTEISPAEKYRIIYHPKTSLSVSFSVAFEDNIDETKFPEETVVVPTPVTAQRVFHEVRRKFDGTSRKALRISYIIGQDAGGPQYYTEDQIDEIHGSILSVPLIVVVSIRRRAAGGAGSAGGRKRRGTLKSKRRSKSSKRRSKSSKRRSKSSKRNARF